MASLRLAALKFGLRASPSSPAASRRTASDLVIQHKPGPQQTPQPVIKYGPPTGGRSAASGHTVTVFGCTGFLGRYTVAKLARQGTQVVIPYRDEDAKRHLKITGDLGQIVPMEWDARNEEQIYECVKHSDVVYNLTGRDWETRNFKYDDVNVKTAALIATVAAKADVPRLIHVSHLNASPKSPSSFYRSKYEGEKAVRAAFPEATIVRPGPLFGAEDWLINAMCRGSTDIAPVTSSEGSLPSEWPVLFRLNKGRTRTLPVHVMDVAEALDIMVNAPVTSVASTFALPGPRPYTYDELLNIAAFFTMKPVATPATLPKSVAKMIATAMNRAVWWPTVSPDEIERRYIDDAGVDSFNHSGPSRPSGWGEPADQGMKGVDGELVKSWADLRMNPEPLEDHALEYFRNYRSPNDSDMPVELGRFKPPKQYHVVP